ncbi:CdaR family protein [Catenisphaera adipataccumulans]|jgi:YbbR domain-containing protein|uniref:YbbR domain-containing protein n=1 Tax=Catenisphaera adipataccumulans TaxID=700500 RepID=A0A7W8FW23_9FIRM|nr:CdaR family protein [Catenisphaera adipataccumulans]MBB5183773.1 YbbR domain-containing protein [Catenisphaera adipataccumulans]
MARPDDHSSAGSLQKLQEFLRFLFDKLSKLFDRIIFSKSGSIIVSLVAAIGICAAVNYQDINMRLTKSSQTSVELSNVPVETLYDSDEYEVSGVPDVVTVTLTGNATDIDVFRKQNDVKVTADLRSYGVGQTEVELSVENLPNDIDASISPSSVTADIQKKVTKQFTVTAELLLSSGQKSSDFESPKLKRSTVKVTGSTDQINSIRTVKALVDATGQTGSFETDAKLVAYDSDGNTVNVDFSPKTIHVTVSAKSDE